MNSITYYAEKVLNLNLTNFQRDALSILESDPDAWRGIMKPKTHHMRLVLEIYKQWSK